MIKSLLNYKLLMLIVFIVSIAFLGCEKKTEQTEQPKNEVQTDQTAPDAVPEIKEPLVEEKITIPDIKGTWTGVFDKRATTLRITEQTDSSFSGKITIEYREVINQDVKGSFSPTTLKMTMTDQLHSRYQGSYSGKLSKEINTYSGTFTMKLDGSKFSFNLNKK
ncbi:MAG: hypothetical protein IPM14_11985 [bacterium]|nr:hypothetical protein [bacterium]